jgi:outer membrane protein assembly factor BamB/tetratricopeptide (TPR) repeat protein
MPLQGSLGHIRLTDVLQTALAGSKGGELVVTCGLERAVLHVSPEGLHLIEPESLEPEDLLAALVARGAVPEQAVRDARAGKVRGLALVDALVASGALAESQVNEVVAGVVEDAVLELLMAREGAFRFQEGASRAARTGLVSRVAVDVEGVLIRAAQRADEHEVITSTLGAHPALFRALDAPVPDALPEIPVAAVHAALDGTATLEEIALTLGCSRFHALQAAAVLVASGAARPATADELRAAIAQRRRDERLRAARALALQWTTLAPDDTDAVAALVEICEARERPLEAAAALTMLGRRLHESGRAEDALKAFEDALTRRPGDLDAQEGLRQAALAQGDQGLWASTTLRLAQAMLEADDPARAGNLAAAVLERQPDDVGARLLRLRAAVAAKDHDGVVVEAQALADRLSTSCSRRVEREAAQFARDAIALLAPERSDLLRTLRGFVEGKPRRTRRVALVGALVAVAAAAGVLTWPESPGSLLARAQQAAADEDRPLALDLVTQLIERFPDSEEAGTAFSLQAQLVPPPSKTRKDAAAKPRELAQKDAARLTASLQSLPAAPAAVELEALVGGLQEGAGLDAANTSRVHDAIVRLGTEARAQQDALALTRSGRERVKGDAAALRALLAAARTAIAPETRTGLRASHAALAKLVEVAKAETLRRPLRELETAVTALEKTTASHAADVLEVRRLLADSDLEACHTACREQGPRLLVGGRIDELEQLYGELDSGLAALEQDKDLLPVLEAAQRRHIPDFLRERRAVVLDIRKGLEAARAAVEAGDLDAAARAYRALAQRHFSVRLDDLVRVPIAISSVPAGAEVSLNGKPLGTTPLRTDYPWGGPNTLSVKAPGFVPHVTLLDTNDKLPLTKVEARLAPEPRWAAPVVGTIEARPVEIGGDVLVCDRSGRLTLFAGADGRELWARHVKNLEGVRHRPVGSDGQAWVAFLDGRLAPLDLRDGLVGEERRLGRPTGDLAAHDGVVALAVATPAVVGLKRGQQLWETPLTAHVSAGLLAAHDALWLGTANGEVLRLAPQSGDAVRVGPTDARGTVVGLVALPDGLLVTYLAGRLARLARDGSVRWIAADLGDLNGPAALVSERVAVTDRRGRLLLLDAANGAPKGTLEAGRETIGGVLARGELVVALLSDGRLWAVDPVRARVAIDAPLAEKGAQALGAVGASDVVVVTRDGRLLRLPVTAPTR